jgi:uracil-DNA glycosylase
LESMLDDIGLKREEVWIGNIIKHRPPKNREPTQKEIQACEPYLTVQLKAINPKLVVTLGRFAMYYFHNTGKISRDHGNLITTPEGLHVYPVYHPAAGLRNGKFREALEDDFKRIPQILKQIELGSRNKNLPSSRGAQEGQLKLEI